MTHVKALDAGQSSQGTAEPVTPVCILNILMDILSILRNGVGQKCTFIFKHMLDKSVLCRTHISTGLAQMVAHPLPHFDWCVPFIIQRDVSDTIMYQSMATLESIEHRRIQVLRLGGSTFLGIRISPPLRGFPEATIKVYTWFFLGFRIAPPLSFFSWSHYKSLYCAFLLKPL